MIVEANAGGEAEIGANLKFVLDVSAGFVRAVIAVGVALQEVGGDESISRVGDRSAREESRRNW